MGFFSKKHGGLNDYTDHVFRFLQDNLTRVVDEFVDLKFPQMKEKISSWLSKVDLQANDKEYILTAEIPEIEKIDANFKDGVLTIILKKKSKKTSKHSRKSTKRKSIKRKR